MHCQTSVACGRCVGWLGSGSTACCSRTSTPGRRTGAKSLRLTGFNLTLTDSGGHALWATGHGGDDLILQPGGNLVEYAVGAVVWASNTVGSGAAWLVVSNEGKLALY